MRERLDADLQSVREEVASVLVGVVSSGGMIERGSTMLAVLPD
jgi:hypothetical protein